MQWITLEAVLTSIADNWVAIAAALVSLLGAAFASSHRRQEMRIGWNCELIAWSREAMLALTEAQALAPDLTEMPPDAAETRVKALRARIAAAADHGRLSSRTLRAIGQRFSIHSSRCLGCWASTPSTSPSGSRRSSIFTARTSGGEPKAWSILSGCARRCRAAQRRPATALTTTQRPPAIRQPIESGARRLSRPSLRPASGDWQHAVSKRQEHGVILRALVRRRPLCAACRLDKDSERQWRKDGASGGQRVKFGHLVSLICTERTLRASSADQA